MSQPTPSITELGMMYTLQEMKNPLTNILLSMELLEAETDEEKKIQFYSIIKKSVLEMGAYITDLHKCFTDEDIQQSLKGFDNASNNLYLNELAAKIEQ